MELTEIKLRLGIPLEDTDNDAILSLRLSDAIDYVLRRTNQTFIDEDTGLLNLPPSAKIAVEKYMSFYSTYTNSNIKSEQIGDSKFEYTDRDSMIKDVDSTLIKGRLIRMSVVK